MRKLYVHIISQLVLFIVFALIVASLVTSHPDTSTALGSSAGIVTLYAAFAALLAGAVEDIVR